MTDTQEQATPTDSEPADETPPTSTRKRRWPWIVGGLAVVLAGAAGVVALTNGSTEPTAEVSINTATVERRDLVATEELDGTLGYGTPETVAYQSSSDGVVTVTGLKQGFVTAIADAGSLIESGDVLYEVNTEPVVVLQGDVPAYRSFTSSMSDGPDVEQLETALVELGYDPDGDIEIDEDFTSATRDAIERLQEAIGAEETGRLLLGDVLFAPLPSLAADLLVEVGDQVQAAMPIVATSKALTGTATWVIDEGAVVESGDVVLAIDDEPVVLLVGDIPLYRALTTGVEGDDVAQLQQTLLDLGFGETHGLEVTGSYDSATLRTVAEWQTSYGAQPDGVVNVGDVIVQPNAVRVNQTMISVGDPVSPGTPVFATSASTTFVSVQLSADDQDLVAVGDAVTVELPSGDVVAAEVSEIGSVALASQQGGTYFEMTVTLSDPTSAQGLDEAPVDVEVESDRADGTLVVPVTALLALAEGGYAVEVVADDGSTLLVAADPGLFADGFVEITADGLQSGMEVVVP